jgi:transposase
MSRYRLQPTAEQESVLLRHCSDARYVWNLCVEQESEYRPGRGPAPGFAERCRQLTEARADNTWLAAGSVTVQQQAIKDYATAMAAFFNGTHSKPTWRKAGRHEGFRIIAVRPTHVRRLNRKSGQVLVPKVGWVRFRWSRAIPDGARSFRVTRDRAGRWHLAFVAIPGPVPAPGTREIVGVDRGVTVTAALSTGELLTVPGLSGRERRRLVKLERKLAKATRGSSRRGRVRLAIARLKAREADRRKDWVEKTSTDLVRRFDVIRVEDLNVKSMTRSAKGTKDKPGTNVARGGDGTSRPVNREPQPALVIA